MARRWLRLWKRVSLPSRGARKVSTLAPAAAQGVHSVLRRAGAPEAVEEHAHLDAGARAPEEGGHDLVAHLALAPDVAGEVHAPPRILEGADEHRKEFFPVVEQPRAAAVP
jgi:hypothetical protein